jgi:colanic acid/amylovoran biosynthesis glycosyltransferase
VDAELSVVGDGPLLEGIKRDVTRRGLDDHVHLVGAVPSDEVVVYYQQADVFCLPSFAEGVPVVLMEAMACELPVVATEITGVPELVEDGVSGYLVTPGRADLLADALSRLTAPELRRRFGAAGRAQVQESFDITTVGRQLVDVFAQPVRGTDHS